MPRRLAVLALLLAPLAAVGRPPHPGDGDAVIRGKAGPSEIVITTTSRLAGAIHSVRWGGKEFVDSADHGRQLQSAAAFDAGDPKDFWAEAYNPEVGWALDGTTDEADAEQLYSVLEEQVVPRFHDRDAWVTMMKHSIAQLSPRFSMQRAVIEYVEGYYLPATAKAAI